MLSRVAVLIGVVLAATGLLAVPPVDSQTEPMDVESQERAADAVMEQLESADGPMAMSEIDGLDGLGPPPWLSLAPDRSEKVVEAWLEVAKQLPSEDLVARHRPRRPRGPIEFTESEAPEETGLNDTPETGERIKKFGTGRGESRQAIINGNLSGAEVQLPVFLDCPSVEDDGAIPLANDAGPNVVFGALCGGLIGDGPHGETTGDTDFYFFGEADVGALLVLDVFNISDSLQPADTVVGIYDADGNLVASAEDSGDVNAPEFLLYEVTEAGDYYGVVAGCCELQSDPFDPASGPGVAETGTYEVFVVSLPPPCVSNEDDGSIPLANQSNAEAVQIDFCSGVIGDGPHGATTGDADFYSLGTVPEGNLALADVVNFEGSPDQVNTVLGLYDAAGTLLATVEDSGDPELPEFLEFEVTATGEYFVAVVGCCELTADPFDSASGPGVTETGDYEVVVGSFPPPPDPCLSVEDDGAIPLANETESKGVGDDVLFFTECLGEVGDGPQAATGDVDFYTTREMTEGKVLVVDFIDADPASRAGEFTIGVYDDAGALLASGQDSPDPEDLNFFQFTVPETAMYQVVISGGLPTDPFDSTTGTNTDIVGFYDVFLVDITQELLDEIVGGPGGLSWRAPALDVGQARAEASAAREADAAALLERRRAEVSDVAAAAAQDEEEEEPVVDTDVFLVDLDVGDVISGGFDAARVTGILDPAGVGRMASSINPSFIYPPDSPARHDRRIGFDHVVTTAGVHAIFVSEGVGPYQGELRVARAGRADERSDAQQIIFLDFDGAAVSPSIFFPSSGEPFPEQQLSPLAAFLPAWGLGPADEDEVIDRTIDAVIENIDTDLRVLDGRNGDRDASGRPTEFDVEVLNSRDHGDRWGEPNVSRIVIGGTIDELLIPTIGIAQSIDPGNLETEETGVVLLDILSGPAPDPVSLNSYELAGGKTKADLIGHAVGHIAAHEVGHYIGNWHTETFNEQVSLMDAGGEFESIFGVGPDRIFGTADDIDADFAEDIFNVFEGFAGVEDTAGRSVFGFSTGRRKPATVPATAYIGDSVTNADGSPAPDVAVDLFTATQDGERISYLRTASTSASGRYTFEVEPGCYSVVFIAPAGRTFVGGGAYDQQAVCVRAGVADDTIDAVLADEDPGPRSSIGDRVTYEDSSGAEGVVVDLFTAAADGSRASFLGDTVTDPDGIYNFSVAPGCYVVVFIAPAGSSFVGGSPWSEQFVCVGEGETNDGIDAVLSGRP